MSLTYVSPVSHDIDLDTAALIAKIALDDLDEIQNTRKGKSREDSPLSDEECALQLQRSHYSQLITLAEDAKSAKSIADAVVADGAYVEALETAELVAIDDCRAAEILARDGILPLPNAAQARLEDKAFKMHPDPPQLSAATFGAVSDEDDTVSDSETIVAHPNSRWKLWKASSVGWRAREKIVPLAGPSVERNKIVHCTICYDEIRYINALHTTCNHHYCRDCVKDLVENFTRDESLYPLRCCQQAIPINEVFPFISIALRSLFQDKHTEFSVLSKDRVYCVNPICSKFLGSSESTTSWAVVCPQCATTTCPACKQASHGGEDCTVNAATVELRAIARREGWQTCPGCHSLIELNLGCYHMTCRCRTQFCYLCAELWKNCACPQWEENRLLATAQQRVENELGPQALPNVAPAVIERQVQQRAEALRYDHHCDRHSWTRRDGGGMCEECHWHLRDFLLICRRCSILACVRCSRNRF